MIIEKLYAKTGTTSDGAILLVEPLNALILEADYTNEAQKLASFLRGAFCNMTIRALKREL